MKATRIMAALAFVLLATPIAFADYAYTPVLVGVTVSKSFTVTLNVQSATNSDPAHPGTATQVVWFNSTDGQTKYVNATVVGADSQVGAYPTCATPIAVFKNTGTTVLTLNVKLNSTISGMVFFYNASLNSGSTTGTPDTAITALSTTGANFVTGLGLNNQTKLCIWANYTGVSGGTASTAFNYTSS